jgi:hypothetical protein
VSTDWGSVPDWLAGAGALLALLFARQAASAAARTDRRQGEQLASIELTRRRSQAEKVAVWFEWRQEHGVRHRLMLRNSSDLPVYDVMAWATLVPGDAGVVERSPEPAVRISTLRFRPAQAPERVLVRRSRYVLPPDCTQELHLDELPPDVRSFYSEGDRFMQLAFRDSAGHFWHRPSGADLVELTKEQFDQLRGQVHGAR